MLGLGGSSTMGLGIVMTLDDQFSKAAKNVTSALGDIDAVVNAFGRVDQFGQGMSNFGFFIAKGLTASVKEFAKFEDIMNSIKVIAGDQGLTETDFQKMQDQVRRLGDLYGILPEFVANAQLELAKAGKKPVEIMKMTEATMALGAATDTLVAGTNGAAEILVNLMQAFNATGDEADKYAAAITSAANQSTIDVKDFYQSIRYSADIANSLGIGIEEVAASIATLGNAGLKGSIAGTSYANMLRYLAKAVGQFGTKQQRAALDLFGLEKEDLIDKQTGSLKKMGELLDLFRAKYKTMSPITALAASQGLMNTRGDRAAQPLIKGLMESNGQLVYAFEDMSRRINDDIANNVHLQQANDRLNDLMGDFDKFNSAMSNLKIAIGSALAPLIRNITQRLTNATKSLTDFFNGPMGKLIVKYAAASSIWLIVLGRMLSFGARFYIWMLTSAGKLSASFKIAGASARIINRSMIQSSLTFLRNITLAANRWVFANNKAAMVNGMGMVQMRGRNGRFGSMVGRASWMTALFGLFGRGGLRVFIKLSAWFSRVLPWMARFGGLIRLVGVGLGRVFGVLFGWPGIIADIILTMTTGKGLFEWLWEGVKELAGSMEEINHWIRSLKNGFSQFFSFDQDISGRVGRRLLSGDFWDFIPNMHRDYPDRLEVVPAPSPIRPTPFLPENLTSRQKDQIKNNVTNNTQSKGNTVIDITVNNNTEGRTKRRIFTDQERQIQSYSIN